jgi:hypothetical protein
VRISIMGGAITAVFCCLGNVAVHVMPAEMGTLFEHLWANAASVLSFEDLSNILSHRMPGAFSATVMPSR